MVNDHDGVHADVTLDGAPNGTPTFQIARTPDGTQAAAQAVNTGGSVWQVAVPHPSLWYLWATDADGQVAVPAACWVGLADTPDLDLAGEQLRTVLEDNRAGLTAALQTFYPGAEVKQIVYGSATIINTFPSILIGKPRESVDWVAFPWVREHVYRFEIGFLIDHQDRASLLNWAARFAARGMEILNNPQYESLTLPSGLSLAFCECAEGDVDEVQLDDKTWAAAGTLQWIGKSLKQDTLT